MRITNLQNLNKDKGRPQVLISGEIHGDERVGPISSYITGKLLVLASQCSGVNRVYNAGDNVGKSTKEQIAACKILNDDYSINTNSNSNIDQLKWLTILAMKRDTFIIPTANCVVRLLKQSSSRLL